MLISVITLNTLFLSLKTDLRPSVPSRVEYIACLHTTKSDKQHNKPKGPPDSHQREKMLFAAGFTKVNYWCRFVAAATLLASMAIIIAVATKPISDRGGGGEMAGNVYARDNRTANPRWSFVPMRYKLSKSRRILRVYMIPVVRLHAAFFKATWPFDCRQKLYLRGTGIFYQFWASSINFGQVSKRRRLYTAISVMVRLVVSMNYMVCK